VSSHPPAYLTGLALFNAGEYFEAHEVLEDLWRATAGDDRRFYQGLIQLAVVLHHLRRGNAVGAGNVLATCRGHLEPYRPEWRGISVDGLLAFVERIAAMLAAGVVALPPAVPRLWPEGEAELDRSGPPA
jgi:predicted metal-dependent hydrolase